MLSSQKKVMDVVFLIDATGSMSATIKAAHDKATEMAITLRVKNPEVDFKFGSVCYRDPIDSPGDVHQIHDLNGDIDSLVGFLSGVVATGGGDGPEDWVGAYKCALDSMKWRDGAKTIIHIADAPAHGQVYCGAVNHEEEAPKLKPLIEAVAKRGILMSCIDLSRGAQTSFNACKPIYEQAGGCKFNIEELDLSGSHSDRVSRCFAECCRSDDVLCDEDCECECECECEYSSEAAPCDAIGDVLCDCAAVACEDALSLFYS
jgi:hypothetical protein